MASAKTSKKTAAAPVVNMFETAEVISPPKKKGGKVDNKVERVISDLEALAIINAAQDNLEAVGNTLEKSVKAQMRDIFIGEGLKVDKRPDNFRGIERTASASCELRKRGANSPLNDLEIAAFKKAGIDTETITIVPERFIINPAHAGNQELLAKISAALQGVEGIPADLFQKQVAEVKVCVPEAALDQLFRLKADEDTPEEQVFAERTDKVGRLFDSVCVLALKTKVEEDVNPADVLAGAIALIKGEAIEEGDTATAAALGKLVSAS